jgi:hypothetical protein
MKMAKLQKATLDPTKISGRCGRLKCCLRYEFDTYEEIQKQLPRIGSQIVTRDGKARVLNHKIITEQLLVETEDHRRIVIDASEVLSVIKKPANTSPKKEAKFETRPARGAIEDERDSAVNASRGSAKIKHESDTAGDPRQSRQDQTTDRGSPGGKRKPPKK